MGLAKRGSRKIEVDGRVFRWVLSPDSGYAVVVVEQYDEPGQRLEAYTKYGSTVGLSRPVTPRSVAGVIRLAIVKGWQPTARGLKPFKLHDVDDHVDF